MVGRAGLLGLTSFAAGEFNVLLSRKLRDGLEVGALLFDGVDCLLARASGLEVFAVALGPPFARDDLDAFFVTVSVFNVDTCAGTELVLAPVGSAGLKAPGSSSTAETGLSGFAPGVSLFSCTGMSGSFEFLAFGSAAAGCSGVAAVLDGYGASEVLGPSVCGFSTARPFCCISAFCATPLDVCVVTPGSGTELTCTPLGALSISSIARELTSVVLVSISPGLSTETKLALIRGLDPPSVDDCLPLDVQA